MDLKLAIFLAAISPAMFGGCTEDRDVSRHRAEANVPAPSRETDAYSFEARVTIEEDSAVWLCVTTANKSGHDIVLAEYDPLLQYRIVVVSRGANVAATSLGNRLMKSTTPSGRSAIVKAGDSQRQDFRLDKLFDLTMGGAFRVECARRISSPSDPSKLITVTAQPVDFALPAAEYQR